jgi:hypothetical protein
MTDAQQPKKLTEKGVFWQQRIQEWEASDLTQAAFCKEHNLSFDSFKKWRHRLSARATRSKRLRLVPIATSADRKAETAPTEQPKALTVHVGALRLDVPQDFDSDHLTKLVRTLQGV